MFLKGEILPDVSSDGKHDSGDGNHGAYHPHDKKTSHLLHIRFRGHMFEFRLYRGNILTHGGLVVLQRDNGHFNLVYIMFQIGNIGHKKFLQAQGKYTPHRIICPFENATANPEIFKALLAR